MANTLNVTYNGDDIVESADISSSVTKTLKCAGKKMKSDVVITAEGGSGGGGTAGWFAVYPEYASAPMYGKMYRINRSSLPYVPLDIFAFEVGMTWADFCASDYNPNLSELNKRFYISGGIVYDNLYAEDNNCLWLATASTKVKDTDTVISGTIYTSEEA